MLGRADYVFAFLLQNPDTSTGMVSELIARISLPMRQSLKLHLPALLRLFSSQGKFLNEIISPSAALISAYAIKDFSKPSGLLPGGHSAPWAAGSGAVLGTCTRAAALTAPSLLLQQNNPPALQRGCLCAMPWPGSPSWWGESERRGFQATGEETRPPEHPLLQHIAGGECQGDIYEIPAGDYCNPVCVSAPETQADLNKTCIFSFNTRQILGQQQENLKKNQLQTLTPGQTSSLYLLLE